jgi:uncharacterized protein YeeX (DUF496 family)
MTAKLKNTMTFLFSASLFLVTSYKANSQGLLDRIKKKTEDAFNKKVDKKVDDVLNGKKKTEGTSVLSDTSGNVSNSKETANTKSTVKPKDKSEQTVISENDFIQSTSFPEKAPNNTRLKIAKNLMLDIKGKYPAGYNPKWRFVSYKSSLDFDVENYVVKRSALGHDRREISIGDYKGKAVLRFGAFITCDCYAEIVIKDTVNVLTATPQTFKVTNFQKIVNEKVTGEKCRSSSNNFYYDGGWEGKITLSADENGDIKMDLLIEVFKPENRFAEAGVTYRYIANNITIENEMSAEKANGIIAAEQEAKQRQKDYISKTTKQADSLQKIIAIKFPQKDCRDCFSINSNSSLQVTPTTTVYTNGYGDVVDVSSGSDWDINTKTEIKNKCGYDLTFVGLKQMYDEEKGYYLMEVTKTMEKGYNYRSDQGAMASIFTSLIGGGSEFNIQVLDKYYPNYATIGAVQWLKVVKK